MRWRAEKLTDEWDGSISQVPAGTRTVASERAHGALLGAGRRSIHHACATTCERNGFPEWTSYPEAVDQTRWLDADEQHLWRAWIRAHTRMVARLDAELQAAHGLSFADYEVLVNLSEAPERSLRMAELAERLRLSPSGLTRRLDGLVGEGWWSGASARPMAGDRWPG